MYCGWLFLLAGGLGGACGVLGLVGTCWACVVLGLVWACGVGGFVGVGSRVLCGGDFDWAGGLLVVGGIFFLRFCVQGLLEQ